MKEIHFRLHIVRPTLRALDMWSEVAEDLLVGTAVHESGGLEAVDQITGAGDVEPGPAFGLFQMERLTLNDHLAYLAAREQMERRVMNFRAPQPQDLALQLMGNHFFAAAMARIHYWRKPERLPGRGDLHGLAAYWKRHYNTPAGKGTVEKFIADWNAHGAAKGAEWWS